MINDRLHMDCSPDECLVKDGHCPLHPSAEDERERRQQRVKSLRGQRNQKQDELSAIQIALNEAILDLHHWEDQQDRVERVVRRVIAIEGRETTDGRFIAPGALTWPESGPVPIRVANDHDLVGKAVGNATNFRREDDGTITADINLLRPVDDGEYFIPFVVIYTSHQDDDVLYLTQGRIADLTIMGPLQWPWKP